ncbi:hypothetical protein [Ralstonia solanacearum]|uniref:hypothetical protein n=1 Tax=Ralstonia solanacearum TaxID=305 RepID=UPI0015607C0B|nr:hypothetical protein [Ralstonia solanacearum]
MNTVTATTPARELPASIRMASRLLNTSCGQLSQLPSHLLAFRARGRKILGLRLHRRAQGIALRFRLSLVHAHLTQFSLHLLAPRLQLAESLGRGASFGGQPCAILVQFCVLPAICPVALYVGRRQAFLTWLPGALFILHKIDYAKSRL